MSYPGYSLVGGSYPSSELQSVHSTAPSDWAISLRDGVDIGVVIMINVNMQLQTNKTETS